MIWDDDLSAAPSATTNTAIPVSQIIIFSLLPPFLMFEWKFVKSCFMIWIVQEIYF